MRRPSDTRNSIGEAGDVDMLSEGTEDSSIRSVVDTQRFTFESHFEHFFMFACFILGYNNLHVYTHFHADSSQVPSVLHHIVASVCVAMPMLYMEMFIGQYTRRGVLMFGRIIPLSYGFGWAVLIITLYYQINVNLHLGDSLFYFVTSFTGLPWMNCKHDFIANGTCYGQELMEFCEHSKGDHPSICLDPGLEYSSILFYEHFVKKMPDWDQPMGGVHLGRVLFSFISWVLVTVTTLLGFSQYKIILQMGCVLILSFFSFIYIMTLVQGGAVLTSSIHMFAIPPGSMTNLTAWTTAVYSSMMMMGLCQGGHILFGSFMSSRASSNNVAIVFTLCNIFASVVGGLFTYNVVYILQTESDSISWKAHRTHALYTTLPQSLGSMSAPQFLSILYFCLLFLSIYQNQVVRLDIIVESIIDAMPKMTMYRKYMVSLFSLAGFILSLPYATGVGFLLEVDLSTGMMDNVFILLYLVESLCVFWLYGTQKFSDDIHYLLGAQPTLFWKNCWRICPAVVFVSLIHSKYYYQDYSHDSVYLTSVRVVSIIYCLLCVSPLVIGGVYKCLKYIQCQNLMGVLIQEPEWGHPDAHERLMRHIYNPRYETRWRRRDPSCKHEHNRCLRNSPILKELILREKMAAIKLGLRQLHNKRVNLTDEDED